MANIRLYGINTSDNVGDGVKIVGDADILINGLVANNNGGIGLNIITKENIYSSLGLPTDINPELISKILAEVYKNPDIKIAKSIVEASDIYPYIIQAGLDLSAFTANLITIATGVDLHAILAMLNR